jgi:hypothetical protein
MTAKGHQETLGPLKARGRLASVTGRCCGGGVPVVVRRGITMAVAGFSGRRDARLGIANFI